MPAQSTSRKQNWHRGRSYVAASALSDTRLQRCAPRPGRVRAQSQAEDVAARREPGCQQLARRLCACPQRNFFGSEFSAHTNSVIGFHLWLGAVLGGRAFSISARHKLKNALMMIGTIGPLELAGLAATYASTCRTRSVSVELARHRWKAVLTGYGASSSGCATAEIYWDIPNTKPRFQISGAFVYSW